MVIELWSNFFLALVLAVVLHVLLDHSSKLRETKTQIEKLVNAEQALVEVRQELLLSSRIVQMTKLAKDHKETISNLIAASIEDDQLFLLAKVSPSRYLNHLKTALDRAKCYVTIQRKSVSWFITNVGGMDLLHTLGNADSVHKVRIFVLDDLAIFRKEIDDPSYGGKYWNAAGNTRTFLVSVQTLAQYLTVDQGQIRDVVLIDSVLLFEYDENDRTLRFAVPQYGQGHDGSKVCEFLMQFNSERPPNCVEEITNAKPNMTT
ncbi:MAG: hypothetical protein NTW49_08700 [Bacteroidia bacterium]|nr:hypothetical protein [Bacteroidia bacterium]